jgi:hypothetical protein
LWTDQLDLDVVATHGSHGQAGPCAESTFNRLGDVYRCELEGTTPGYIANDSELFSVPPHSEIIYRLRRNQKTARKPGSRCLFFLGFLVRSKPRLSSIAAMRRLEMCTLLFMSSRSMAWSADISAGCPSSSSS